MATDFINPRDLRFMLHELLDVGALTARPRFVDHGRETFDAALETAYAIARDRFAPFNQKQDAEEPRLEEGRVAMVPEMRAALDAFNEAGFGAAHVDYELGGMQLPWVVARA